MVSVRFTSCMRTCCRLLKTLCILLFSIIVIEALSRCASDIFLQPNLPFQMERMAPHLCHLCDAHFSKLSSLKEHLRAGHQQGETTVQHQIIKAKPAAAAATASKKVKKAAAAAKALPCPKCSRRFPTKTDLNVHLAIDHLNNLQSTAEPAPAVVAGGSAGASSSSASVAVTPLSEKCPNCRVDFPTQTELRTHFASTHQEGLINNVS